MLSLSVLLTGLPRFARNDEGCGRPDIFLFIITHKHNIFAPFAWFAVKIGVSGQGTGNSEGKNAFGVFT